MLESIRSEMYPAEPSRNDDYYSFDRHQHQQMRQSPSCCTLSVIVVVLMHHTVGSDDAVSGNVVTVRASKISIRRMERGENDSMTYEAFWMRLSSSRVRRTSWTYGKQTSDFQNKV